jgi:dephospho-CoA kinase
MRRMECQQPFAEAREAADVVIHNDGSIEELEEKVRSLWGLRVEGRISHQ